MEQNSTDTVAVINRFVSSVDDERHKNIGAAQVVVVLAQFSVSLAQLVMTMPYLVFFKICLKIIWSEYQSFVLPLKEPFINAILLFSSALELNLKIHTEIKHPEHLMELIRTEAKYWCTMIWFSVGLNLVYVIVLPVLYGTTGKWRTNSIIRKYFFPKS